MSTNMILIICGMAIGFAGMFFAMNRMRRRLDNHSIPREERYQGLSKWWGFMFASFAVLMASLMLSFAEAGKEDRAAHAERCAKHGLKAVEGLFHGDMCADEDGRIFQFNQ